MTGLLQLIKLTRFRKNVLMALFLNTVWWQNSWNAFTRKA
jgi:hypothetical protein